MGLQSPAANLGIQQCTHWIGGLKFGGLESGDLQSPATSFGSRKALIGLRVYSLGVLGSAG